MSAPTTTHRTAELRSIALHELVAGRLRADPAVLTAARARVDGWLRDGGPVDPRYAERWRALLARQRDEVADALVADTEAMRDLRQARPSPASCPSASASGSSARCTKSPRQGSPAMLRAELEHVIRASAVIADDDEIVIVGSQAVLGEHPGAPAAMLASIEADVYPRAHPERARLIDGAIGEGSLFHDQFGYSAQGVGPETAKAPAGWEARLVPIQREHAGRHRLVHGDARPGARQVRRRS